jgi:hypothetical protein
MRRDGPRRPGTTVALTAMPRARPVRVSAIAGLAVLAAATSSEARRLFAPRAHHPGLAGIERVRSLTIDRRALADLRASTDTVLDAFPLGDGRIATLVLRRFSPFSAGARAEVMTVDGPKALPLPDAAYFAGTVDGDPASLALVVAGAGEAHGFVATGGDVHLFGPEQGLRHRAVALRNVDPTMFPRPRDFCLNDLRPDAPLDLSPPPLAAMPPPVAATGTLKVADIAIETDNELRAKFASDQATLDWLGTLLAATTAIYERDVSVRLQFSYVRIWSSGVTDPWTTGDTEDSLYEVQNHWNTSSNPVYAVGRDLVHFVSGKSVTGGIAYVNVLCNGYYGYGVSQVYGSFDLTNPNAIWDVEVFAHELGHNFGSPHTHCYNPPVDQCYGLEGGCYSGTSIASQGTIMSYCHLHAGGLANITLEFGSTVSTRIGQSVAAASCLATLTTTTTTDTTTSTTTSTTTTTSPGGTTTTTTGASTTTTTTTTSTSTTTQAATTSTTTSPAGSTTTTLPETDDPDVDADEDEDGVGDDADVCPETPPAELVDATGCSVCPCAGPRDGGSWRTRGRYLRCVRAAIRAATGASGFDPHAALRQAQKSSCGRRGITRCCVDVAAGVACRLMKATACTKRSDAGLADDAGAGSCLPAACE